MRAPSPACGASFPSSSSPSARGPTLSRRLGHSRLRPGQERLRSKAPARAVAGGGAESSARDPGAPARSARRVEEGPQGHAAAATAQHLKRRFLMARLADLNEPPKVDLDPVINSDLANSREVLLGHCQASHWQFNNLRYAQYSTMMLLTHLSRRGGAGPGDTAFCLPTCSRKRKEDGTQMVGCDVCDNWCGQSPPGAGQEEMPAHRHAAAQVPCGLRGAYGGGGKGHEVLRLPAVRPGHKLLTPCGRHPGKGPPPAVDAGGVGNLAPGAPDGSEGGRGSNRLHGVCSGGPRWAAGPPRVHFFCDRIRDAGSH